MNTRPLITISRLLMSTFLGLFALTAARAEESPLPQDWFAGPWFVYFRAGVEVGERAGEKVMKSDDGTVFSKYSLALIGKVLVKVEQDGKLAFEQPDAAFHHRAEWKTAEGKPGDYSFDAAGVLKGSGQFADGALKLNVEWTSGEGRGTSSGSRIAKPVGTHTLKSEWTLKPVAPKASAKPGDKPEKLFLSASRSSQMPQQLEGCPSLQLIEQVTIVRAATADLEVKAKDAPDPVVPAGKAHTLTVTVTNLGPDDSLGTMLRVVLSEGDKFLSAGEARPLSAESGIVTFYLDKLANRASVKFDIRLEYQAAPKSEAKEAAFPTLVQVSGAGYDPNQANNGRFVRASEGTEPDKVR